MSSPKFTVGEAVAVCTPTLSVVIPETKVAGVVWRPAHIGIRINNSIWNAPAGYYYTVQAMPFAPDGAELAFYEPSLRPLLPGEYLDTTQDQALPVDGVSA